MRKNFLLGLKLNSDSEFDDSFSESDEEDFPSFLKCFLLFFEVSVFSSFL